MDYYSYHLELIGKLYPDLYLKIIDLSPSSIKGTLNDLLTSKIDFKDEKKIRGFFKTRLFLDKYLDTQTI